MSDAHERMNVERDAFWAALATEAPDLGSAASPRREKEIPVGQGGRLELKM